MRNFFGGGAAKTGFTAVGNTTLDLIVYASTPAGIAAAVVNARQGHRVALLEPSSHFGGLLTGGLSYTDFRTLESVTGFFREYMDRVVLYYQQTYGVDSQPVKDCFFGAHAEPHVSTAVLRQIVADIPTLQLFMEHRVWSVDRIATPGGLTRIVSIDCETTRGLQAFAAKQFIDASYEGDLAAAAGVPYRIGRESTCEYGERFAGVLFFDNGKILPGSSGEADHHAQCANFRPIMTDRAENRLPVQQPSGYRREEFLRLIPLFNDGRIREIFTESTKGILRVQRIPNGKADINDIKHAPIRLSLAGENDGWAEGSTEDRQHIFNRHKQYTLCLIYFLQNDDSIPTEVREKAREWGWAKDEFVNTGHFPPALYVREARRIYGEYTFTEHDAITAPQSVRTPLHVDAIAIGDYSLNSHGHQAAGPLYPELVEGDFGFSTTPFQIPYGVILPRTVENLLVPVAVSASHVGFSALRLEPTWTALGHAASLAAHLAMKSARSVRAIDVGEFQRMLHSQLQSTIYTSDISPRSKYFRAVQWAGLRGLLSSLADYRTARIHPLRKRYGLQYSYAFDNHAVDTEKALDPLLRTRWLSQLPQAVIKRMPLVTTRGEFLLAAHRASLEIPQTPMFPTFEHK